MLHRITLLAALTLLSTLPLSAQQFNKAKLDSLLTALADHHKLMGSLVLSQNGQVVYRRAVGLAQPNTAATPATHYRIGSVTKLFTAALVLQLVEEGRLAFSTPLATWFPQLPNAARITVDHLLHHRSGLANFTSAPAYQQYLTQPQTQAQMLTIMGGAAPEFEPGARFAYSNTNYVLLGYIVEKITGQPYAQAVQQRIATKLGLKDTYYGGRIRAKAQEAASFRWNGAAWLPEPETDMSIPGGAGALVSTPADLARFVESLFGGQLLKPASLQLMLTMQDGYGIALMRLPFYDKTSYGHFGGIDGFNAALAYFPQEKLAVAYCGNGLNYNFNDALIGVLSVYFGKPYRIPTFEAAPTLTATELSRYAGTYASSQFPLKVAVTATGTTLMAQATGQGAFPLTPQSATHFVYEPAGVQMDFDVAKGEFTLRQGGGSYLFKRE
ncbi:serine hydrolase domain-containing protein [Hymenobacter weizhouensis]|uniref:serine hydrolase domain-containing protein n=1 Tax=Hymenobacter sp. YIM 151500-1 TaxID=2987689 RepID=UPI002227981A|nr:serine hydrolase domain-containing protein [Hymenobacter sp. YIM 151500-1]UYZ62625.1 beta-lactamase family protein [Hymenobacter sp. YIM 151500-1]